MPLTVVGRKSFSELWGTVLGSGCGACNLDFSRERKDMGEFMKVSAVGEFLACSSRTVIRMIQEDKLEGAKVHGTYYVSRKALDTYWKGLSEQERDIIEALREEQEKLEVA